MSSKVTCRILRDGPVTKIAEFYVRDRRYAINVDYLETEEKQQWFLRVISGILREIDERAASQTQCGMQAKLRELLGLVEERNVFAEAVHVSKATLNLT